MTTPKAIKYTLLFPAAYFIISLFLYQQTFNKGEGAQFILTSILVCLIFWGIGIFFGIVISAIIRMPLKEPYFYFAGQILLILLFLFFTGYDIYKERQHEKEFGNIEHNRSYLNLGRDGENTFYSNPPYVKTAFNQLESEFANENDFRITDFFSSWRDSSNGRYTDTLRIVYFTYILKNKKEYFSRLTVFENKAFSEILNGNPLTDQNFIKAKSEAFKERERQEKMATETLKELKESLK